jgi:hypothetical protein
MAAGAWVIPDKALLNFVSATNLLAQSTAGNWRVALIDSGFTPDDATDEVWADFSGDEIANGDGYTTGGAAPASVSLSESGGTVTFDIGDVVWTASGSGIPAWRRAVLYYAGTLNSKVNPVLGHFLGDNTPADVPITTDGNTLTIEAHASGVLTLAVL